MTDQAEPDAAAEESDLAPTRPDRAPDVVVRGTDREAVAQALQDAIRGWQQAGEAGSDTADT